MRRREYERLLDLLGYLSEDVEDGRTRDAIALVRSVVWDKVHERERAAAAGRERARRETPDE